MSDPRGPPPAARFTQSQPTKPAAPSSSKDNVWQGDITWQLLGVAIVTFIVFLVSTCLSLYTASKTSFPTEGAKTGSVVTLSLFLAMAILFPILYFVYALREIRKGSTPITPKYLVLFLLTLFTFLLIITTCSLSIWMVNRPNWNFSDQQSPIKITFIVLLTLGLVLPAFWFVFHFRRQICTQVEKYDQRSSNIKLQPEESNSPTKSSILGSASISQ